MKKGMSSKLTAKQLGVLKIEERKLRRFCQLGEIQLAEESLRKIQAAFIDCRSHKRILTAKLHFAEALIDSREWSNAKSFASSVAKRATIGSRVYINAVSLLAVCELRQGDVFLAQKHVIYVTENAHKIKSERKRQQFLERLQSRIKEECIISQLIKDKLPAPSPVLIKSRVETLVKLTDDEILISLSNGVRGEAFKIALDIQHLMYEKVETSDRLRLPAPKPDPSEIEKGGEIMDALRRIAWKTCCDQEKSFFNMWSGGLAVIFGGAAYFKFLSSAFAEWGIGGSEIISAFAATIVKEGCGEFCNQLKPASLMISPHE